MGGGKFGCSGLFPRWSWHQEVRVPRQVLGNTHFGHLRPGWPLPKSLARACPAEHPQPHLQEELTQFDLARRWVSVFYVAARKPSAPSKAGSSRRIWLCKGTKLGWEKCFSKVAAVGGTCGAPPRQAPELSSTLLPVVVPILWMGKLRLSQGKCHVPMASEWRKWD